MLARPLFASDWRPGAAAKASVRAAAVLRRLTGMLIYDDSRRALFVRINGQSLWLCPKAKAASSKVQKIEAGQVTLLRLDGTRVVRPTFDSPAATG